MLLFRGNLRSRVAALYATVSCQRSGREGGFLVGFGTLVPLVHGSLGVLLGLWVGLSPGGDDFCDAAGERVVHRRHRGGPVGAA